MTLTPRFNALPLKSVKAELEDSLASIGRELENYFASRSSTPAALNTALAELHRVQGVLQMLSLKGTVVFCQELAKLLQELAASTQEMSPAQYDVLRRALSALANYLDALTEGAPNLALRLFPEYQELHQARGLEMAFEMDLFFPELEITLPEEILQPVVQGDVSARFKAARTQYQQALLKWLRRDHADEALRAMQSAIQATMVSVPQGQARAFWWVASGLIDCLINETVPSEQDVKKLLGRVDLQMKSLIDGGKIDTEITLSEMLFLVAGSGMSSDKVAQIKQVYALDEYLPKVELLLPSVTAALLGQMSTLLNEAEQIWEVSVTGDEEACARFSGQTRQLYQLSEQLAPDTLQAICKQINDVAERVVEPELVALDMAMALLSLRGGIENYHHLGERFHEQTRLLDARLQAGLMKKPTDVAGLTNLSSLYCELDQGAVAMRLATEMLSNLKHIEQSLNAFFADIAQRAELPRVGSWLHQVQGGLNMLSLEVAERIVIQLRQMTERFAAEQPTPAEMRWMALCISALGNYLHDVELGQAPDSAILNDVLQDAAITWVDTNRSVSGEDEATSTGVAVRAGGEDEELLEVFLEEASEVMETLRGNLEILRGNLAEREPLTTIRRVFHTLKGSGRMVGLKELGEVAWAVERAMNKWLQEAKPATPAVLELIGDAEVLFQHWVEMLEGREASAKIDTKSLLEAASRIENGIGETAAESTSAVAEVEPEAIEPVKVESKEIAQADAEEEEERLVIGSVSLSPILFSIATEEAANHARALQKQWATLRAEAVPVVPYDFMRSAHTLAGVNRTMGFVQIAELAYALEMWLEERIDKTFVMDDAQLALLEQTISRLDEMCAEVRNRQEPSAQTALIEQLQATREIPVSVAGEVAVDETAAKQPLPETRAETVIAPQASAPAREQRSSTVAAQQADEMLVRDEVDDQLLPIFLEEANELYPQISSTLRAWREQAGDMQLGLSLQRSLHTLKGSARMAGAMRLGELTHRVEGRVDAAIAKSSFDDALWEELEGYLDRIGNAIELLANIGNVEEVEGGSTLTPIAQQQMLEVGAERAIQAALLRVRSDTVDRLVNEAGEVSVARSRVELELREFKNGILELTDSVYRLRQQLREIEIQAEGQIQARTLHSGESAEKFDPLEFDRYTRFQELTRFMNESVHDVQTIQQALLKNLSETEAALTAQGQINRELQQGLMAIRMVPFASVSERLYRVVRQTSKELGRRANLELIGTELELDRSVLEKMTAPFEHLLRNAIAHGLETPEQRERMGKASIGEIRLSLRQESNEVVFECSDDGAGLDLARLQQKAVEHGVLQQGEEISEEQAIQMIFKPGLSTAQEITEISGRGVGLDVVRSEISALGGRLDVVSTAGKGVSFTIHLPLTLAVSRTLMVRAGKDAYALPATMVEQVQQIKPLELEEVYHARQVEWQGRIYPLYYLTRLLNDGETEPVSRPYNALLLLHSGENRIALHVDELIGNQEVVVKNIGPQLARLPGIAGATVMGNGTVVLIINPIVFAQQITVSRKAAKTAEIIEPVHRVPLVMVVDDSLTVRKITSRLLLRAGYQVATAKDGEDALVQLADLSPAVMLLDVEMPRMDGFELAKRLRQDDKTKDLPIIMITSRTADKHRNYALEIGVNEYMGKPYQEEALLEQLTRYAPLSESTASH